ncbi:MAG: hypothetical protein WCD45_11250 [Gallionella sp.]
MKHVLITCAIAAATASFSALAADVGISVGIGQPGFFGRLDIGGYAPLVMYPQPIIIDRTDRDRDRPPIYLRVPPEHARHWRRHCREYNACGERVFFVQEDWYNREYAPRYEQEHRDYRDNRRDERRDENRDNGHRDHHEYNRERDR